ncbi:MAG: energy-coupling factor transporter transmembrane protein EcfT [Desulfatitalea sp.]|nr:energy-coupling factor transporter transmembrane protein EcfT [Desulfatitalea sp.]
MAQLSVFGYRWRSTALHAMDARIKLAALMALSTASLAAGITGMLLASVLVAAAFHQTGTPLVRALGELRYFLILLIAIWMLRSASTPGDPLLTWQGMVISRQGVFEGAMLCWRWLLIVFLGMTVCATTRSSGIRAAVEWFLRPLPGVQAHRVGTMIGLLLRFIPVILTQARETADAQRARAVENRKNPIYRMRSMGLPMLRRTFLMADRLAIAMEARCFGDQRTPHAWHFQPMDRIALVIVIVLCVIMIFA